MSDRSPTSIYFQLKREFPDFTPAVLTDLAEFIHSKVEEAYDDGYADGGEDED